MQRRDELVEQALDYVLAHGLIGLSLRPLAASLGTSDRMLIYHFTSKQRLVETIVAGAQRRLADSMAPPGPELSDLPGLIHHLWTALATPAAAAVTRLYLEVAMLAVHEPERWGNALDQLRGPWRAPLQSGLLAFGVDAQRAGALTDLILATLDGLALERLTAADPQRVDAAVIAFADLLAAAYPPTG